MKITCIELYRVAMPLISPWRTAYGEDDAVESVLVRLCAGEDYGWGESCSLRCPTYSPECAAAQFLISRQFVAPLLLGQDLRSGQHLQERLSAIKGNPFAKAGFDMAWWDLHARRLCQPLWQMLGGTCPSVEAGADFGVLDSLDQLLDAVRLANEQRFKRVKLKCRPGWDLPMIESVRRRFPDMTFHVDCNGAYAFDDLEMFRRLDRCELAMIEQPLAYDDLIDHAVLQARIRTPICLDESITSPAMASAAIQIRACRWINIKPGRVGGTTNALAIHDLAQQAGIPCWVGGMLESAVGAAHCLALATLPNMRYPSDVFPSDRFYRDDLGEPAMHYSSPGQFRASMSPGIGVEPKSKVLKRMTLERAVLRA